MKHLKKIIPLCLLALVLVVGITLLTPTAHAATSGDFEYTVTDGAATITCYTGTSISNSSTFGLIIPRTLDGYPVIAIGNSAFSFCSDMHSVTIPDSVTSIGEYAFYNCTSLVSVNIGNGVTTIGDSAFSGCEKLQYLTLGSSVTTIGNSAFRSCSRLSTVKIGNSVTSIGSYAFTGCTNLQSITIGNSVTYIGNYAFNGCSLQSVTIPDSVTRIGNYVFYKCYSLQNVTIGNGIIGNNAFGYCENLQSVTIGNRVPSIGEYAFYNCTSLKSIIIPDSVTEIGNHAFFNCSKLTSITIGSGLKSVGESAFTACDSLTGVYITDLAAWCNISFDGTSSTPLRYAGNLYLNNKWLTNLVIPDNVTEICQYAFYNCKSLKSVTIPDSVTSIGSSAFSGCSQLTNIYITDLAAWCNISFASIYSNPLYYAKNLYLKGELVTNLTIPESVTEIGDAAFIYCSSLQSVTLHDNVSTISLIAFQNCSSLESITIPKSVTSIGSSAFSGCTSLTDVYYAGSEAQWSSISIDNYNTTLNSANIHYNHIHDYSLFPPTVFVEATCTQAGIIERTCVHGETHRETLFPLGHNVVTITLCDPTCTEQGVSKPGTMCDRCQEVFVQPTYVPALGHNYADGFCNQCGDLTGDGVANNADVVALMWNVLFPEEHPLPTTIDFNGDGKTTNEDVAIFIWHVLFPKIYPL